MASDKACRTRGLVIRVVLHGGAPRAVELEHGLHGGRNGQHLEPSTSRAEHRLRADRGNRSLAGPHHGDARALFGDLQNMQALEAGTAAPMGVVHGLELEPVAGDAANEFPRTAANGLLELLLLAYRLEVLLGHDRAFRRNGTAQGRGKAELRLVGVDAHRQVVDDVDALDRAAHRAGRRRERFGDIWRSRLNFTSCAITGSPLGRPGRRAGGRSRTGRLRT